MVTLNWGFKESNSFAMQIFLTSQVVKWRNCKKNIRGKQKSQIKILINNKQDVSSL